MAAPSLVTTLALAQSVPDAARAAVIAAATAPDNGGGGGGVGAAGNGAPSSTPLAGALVYLDAGAAEVAALSWGGAAFLTGLGAAAVCDLDCPSPDDALLPAMVAATVPPPPPDAGRPTAPPSSASFPVVFFITSLLTDAHGAMVRALSLAAPRAPRATVLCGVTEAAHACSAATHLGLGAYDDCARALRADAEAARAALSGGAGATTPPAAPLRHVAVRHVPMAMAALDGSAFVLPAASAAATLALAGCGGPLPAGYGPAGRRRRRRPLVGDGGGDAAEEDGGGGGSSDDDDDSDEEEEDDDDEDDPERQAREGGLGVLAHALAGAGAQLGLRFDAFALGPASRRVARCVQRVCEEEQGGGVGGALIASSLPQSSSSSSGPALRVVGGGGGGGGGGGSTLPPGPARAALILVDRSLDLATPALHADHPLDAMPEMLPRRPPIRTGGGGGGGGAAAAAGAGAGRAAWRPADMRVSAPGFAALDPLADLVAGEAEDKENGGGGGGGGDAGGTAAGGEKAAAAAAKPPVAAPPSPLPPLGLALSHPSDLRALSQLEQLRLKRGGKECGLLLRRWLREACRAERLAPSAVRPPKSCRPWPRRSRPTRAARACGSRGWWRWRSGRRRRSAPAGARTGGARPAGWSGRWRRCWRRRPRRRRRRRLAGRGRLAVVEGRAWAGRRRPRPRRCCPCCSTRSGARRSPPRTPPPPPPRSPRSPSRTSSHSSWRATR
jgi:hypothetical protein